MLLIYLLLTTAFGIAISEIIRYSFGFDSFFRKQKNTWIGFDLDGTLAKRVPPPFDPKAIGEPIRPMVDLVKKYLSEGKDVKIFTARVSTNGTWTSIRHSMTARKYIKIWCKKNFGTKLDIVCVKDFMMRGDYDDMAIQVETDTGKILSQK